jgi:hypothetical protein
MVNIFAPDGTRCLPPMISEMVCQCQRCAHFALWDEGWCMSGGDVLYSYRCHFCGCQTVKVVHPGGSIELRPGTAPKLVVLP